jgi:hypothetical protein
MSSAACAAQAPGSPSPQAGTVAGQQVWDICQAAARDELTSREILALVDELEAYLARETERFESFPFLDRPDYDEGVALVLEGLRQMQEACERLRRYAALRDPALLQAAPVLAAEADATIGRGYQLLQRARDDQGG